MTQSEIKAAIRLLDDPDGEVYKIVRGKLLGEGTALIPALRQAASVPSAGPLMQGRIESIVSKIEFAEISKSLQEWLSSDGSLLSGMSIVSRLKYFSLTEDDLKSRFTALKSLFPKFALSGNWSDTEKIKIVNYFLYDTCGFSHPQPGGFFDPDSCFIPDVLNTKIGSPVALAAVYMILCESLGINVRGVNMPKNFIIAYTGNTGMELFYVNPFNSGAIFQSKDITDFLKQQKIKPLRQFYEPCSNTVVLLRHLAHLERSYRTNALFSKADNVSKLIKLFDVQLDKDVNWL